MPEIKKNSKLEHLKNAGQMGKRLYDFDWESTSLGHSDNWPPSLIITLGIMLENKFAMYIVWGPEFVQLYNDEYSKILGSKNVNALGSPAIKTWPEAWDNIHPLFLKVFRGEAVQFDNYKLDVDYSGSIEERFYTFSYCPIRKVDNTIAGVLNTVIDTTNDVLNQKALVKSEHRFKSMLERAVVPFFTVAPSWVIDYMNPSSLEMLDMKAEDVIGRTLWDVYPGLEDSIFGDSYKRCMLGEKISFTGFYPNFNRWYQVNAYPYDNGIGVSFLDVTEGKAMEEKLNEAIIVRDDFLSISSHELNTPLTSMKIQSQLLNRDIANKNPKAFEEKRIIKFAEHTEKLIVRMTRLIDDMLDVARIRSGKLNINKEEIHLIKFFQDVLARMEPHFKVAGLGLPVVTISGCDDVLGLWDSLRIEQVITNLISNAIRYGDGKPIHIDFECKDYKIVISIKDEGVGIDEAGIAKIFNRFERASEKQKTKGLGLGLFISNQIISAHGGKIYVKSTPGAGSTFTIELPISS